MLRKTRLGEDSAFTSTQSGRLPQVGLGGDNESVDLAILKNLNTAFYFSAIMIKDKHTGFFIYNGDKLFYEAGRCVEVWAPSFMDYEVIAEVFMLIRIIRLDKLFQKMQRSNIDRYIATVIAAATAGYTDRKQKFRVLCGSI